MHERILTLARTVSGAVDTEASLLEMLCTVQEQAWSERLREGIAPQDCEEAFCCACAFSAVAGLLTSRSGGESLTSFRAGDISVKKNSGAEVSSAMNSLLSQAERLMAPYTTEDDFCFRGVRA